MPAMRRGNNTDSGYPRDRRVGNRKPQNAALRHLSGLTPSKKHRASSPRVDKLGGAAMRPTVSAIPLGATQKPLKS